ncbi:hypothetical protein JJL56_09065 [Azospirillum sp. YIM DDC1]|uniref:PH domain-containing protein n=1 Tax=Azospirillum aestuarii TaxID=2802052 RepID=A0ABS1HW47_9PROT|nr:hypothetical protein [Azospirillum aestuarii]MBK4719019.1 hypothetical protein [Azospirillum aestuarii]
MDAESKTAASDDDVFVAYALWRWKIFVLSLNVLAAAWGLYLFKLSKISAPGAWLGVVIIIVSIIGSTEIISLLFHKGPTIKADKNGLFIYGQTMQPVPWENISSADHGMALSTPDVPTTYILKVAKAGRNRLRPSLASAYTRRHLRLSSVGSTASGKDVRRVLKIHVANLLWHIASDTADGKAE